MELIMAITTNIYFHSKMLDNNGFYTIFV